MASYPDRCQHLKINGTQCGSPALRRNRFCFFHKRFQEERIRLAVDRKRRPAATLILPLLEDANSIQMALQQVMRLVLSHDIDYKTAGLLTLCTANRQFQPPADRIRSLTPRCYSRPARCG
jgi:hypothetical protein